MLDETSPLKLESLSPGRYKISLKMLPVQTEGHLNIHHSQQQQNGVDEKEENRKDQ